MSSDNSSVVLRFFDEVWNQRRGEAIDELMPPDSVCQTDQGPLHGCEGFRQHQYLPLLGAFPDLQVEVDAILEQGDDVVVRWSATGTHTGEGLPIPPTQKATAFSGISWIRVRDGKLREGWQSSNIAEVIRKLAEPAPVG